MVFVLGEDGGLEVIETNEITQRYEPLDVESGVFVFYDEDGTWLQPRFTPTSSVFELVRNSELDATVDPFEVVLGEVFLEPNNHFKSLSEISEYVAARRRSLQKDVG